MTAVALLALLLVAADPPATPAAGSAALVAQVEGLKDDQGKVHAALYASAEGIPTEGLAASNDAKGFMGPPSFEKARVEVGPGENRITVQVSY